MTDQMRLRVLKVIMVATGIFFVVGIFPLTRIWSAGWRWEPFHPAYEGMIGAIYVALAICLIWGARNPVRHILIIWFTIISSILHGAVMVFYALAQPGAIMHLAGDVLFLFVVAVLFLIFIPWGMLREQQKI